MYYWYGDNPNCGRCGHLNGHGHCNMTACIYPVIETTTIVTPEIKPQTNGDRIRAMTDEDLADFINDTEFGFIARPGMCDVCDHHKIRECLECWLCWLRQEAKA